MGGAGSCASVKTPSLLSSRDPGPAFHPISRVDQLAPAHTSPPPHPPPSGPVCYLPRWDSVGRPLGVSRTREPAEIRPWHADTGHGYCDPGSWYRGPRGRCRDACLSAPGRACGRAGYMGLRASCGFPPGGLSGQWPGSGLLCPSCRESARTLLRGLLPVASLVRVSGLLAQGCARSLRRPVCEEGGVCGEAVRSSRRPVWVASGGKTSPHAAAAASTTRLRLGVCWGRCRCADAPRGVTLTHAPCAGVAACIPPPVARRRWWGPCLPIDVVALCSPGPGLSRAGRGTDIRAEWGRSSRSVRGPLSLPFPTRRWVVVGRRGVRNPARPRPLGVARGVPGVS